MRVDVKPELLRWARERASLSPEDLARPFPKYDAWESGTAKPTLKQLEKFASKVHAPIGYFFLSEPPDEPKSIPDFRTIEGMPPKRPSLDLLDTVHLCQRRQDWYREHARADGAEPLAFVGSANLSSSTVIVAAEIRRSLNLDLDERRDLSTWTDALRRLVDQADSLGALVMVSGVVGNNTGRKLDPDEFRGFALSDDIAPLIFVNGADTKAAQMSTLAHELAHLWLGRSALSNSPPNAKPSHTVERWCNWVAAELLAPLSVLREEYRPTEDLHSEASRLARRFKVSALVVLRRIRDAGGITWEQLDRAYEVELKRLKTIPGRKGSGDFYRTHFTRVGRRFTDAIVVSALEGRTSFTESYRLLGIERSETFDELARRLKVAD